ncbi:MAG: tRNA 2-thiouridine(34) synthase MnmA [Candidatus Saccharibacteria bacterium]|nr:tRNA 2-thiouridine(34) synthase MnmA [Candidatus Saccharibacteria bacterium]
MSKTVFVGMSGGVDSSVSALLLRQQGYKVVGVYMKNWSQDLPGMKCPWAEDLADAKRVAVKLGIDFEVWDFEKEYRKKVVDYMLAEFKAGNTPNPDIMCNQEIKFKLFYEKAMKAGADFIATGHYARIIEGKLAKAVDEKKDQTYFLYRISDEALSHTIFPIGGMLKKDVKKLAEENGLHNAYKKESMGVCFVGEVSMKDFLKEYIEIKPGEIREIETEKVVGHHEGAVFYTIGQRHGLYISGNVGEVNTGLPYYVVKKDLKNNIVYVSRNLNNDNVWVDELKLKDVVVRTEYVASRAASGRPVGTGDRRSFSRCRAPKVPRSKYSVRLRHLGELIPATLQNDTLHFERRIKKPAAGQSAVFYDGEICLGGGIIL